MLLSHLFPLSPPYPFPSPPSSFLSSASSSFSQPRPVSHRSPRSLAHVVLIPPHSCLFHLAGANSGGHQKKEIPTHSQCVPLLRNEWCASQSQWRASLSPALSLSHSALLPRPRGPTSEGRWVGRSSNQRVEPVRTHSQRDRLASGRRRW